MSNESFDPYFKWLGISPANQPPTHYRMLGLDEFTADKDVISNAADRQMMLIRTFQSGPYSAHSQRILNELAAARTCLLDSQLKRQYDNQLRAKQGSQLAPARETFVASTPPAPARVATSQAAPPQAVPMTPPVVAPQAAQASNFGLEPLATSPELIRQQKLRRSRKKRASQKSNVVFWVVGIGAVLLLTVLMLFSRMVGGGDETNLSPETSEAWGASTTESDSGTAGETKPAVAVTDVVTASYSRADWNVVGSRDWLFNGDEVDTKLEMQPGSWLMSRQEYGDCLTTFEYVLQKGGAGGVYVRVPNGATWPWNQGLEIHLKDDHADSTVGHESTGSVWHRTPPEQIASRPLGQWNKVRVECRGRDITVEINGKQVTRYRMNDRMPRAGHVGLDGVSGGITYRDFVVQELK